MLVTAALLIAPYGVSAGSSAYISVTAQANENGTTPGKPLNFDAVLTTQYRVDLTWTMGNYATSTLVRGKIGSPPLSTIDGYLVYQGTDNDAVDAVDYVNLDVDNNTIYYRAWSINVFGYSNDYAEDSVEGSEDMSTVLLLIGMSAIGLGFMSVGYLTKRWYLPPLAAFAWIGCAVTCFSGNEQWSGQWWFGILSILLLLSCIVEPIIMKGNPTSEVGEEEKARQAYFDGLEGMRKLNRRKISGRGYSEDDVDL